jgi:predicted DNA-binding antitoxin AbrB/MazE fold protein
MEEYVVDTMEIEAVYDHGNLKLPRELPLQNGQKVIVTIHSTETTNKRIRASVPWHGSQADLDYLILSDDNDPLEAP